MNFTPPDVADGLREIMAEQVHRPLPEVLRLFSYMLNYGRVSRTSDWAICAHVGPLRFYHLIGQHPREWTPWKSEAGQRHLLHYRVHRPLRTIVGGVWNRLKGKKR